jgi:hypothetical protein
MPQGIKTSCKNIKVLLDDLCFEKILEDDFVSQHIIGRE